MGDGITAEFNLGAIQCQYKTPKYSKTVSDVLLHDRKPQRIAQCMTFAFELERSSRLGGTRELSSLEPLFIISSSKGNEQRLCASPPSPRDPPPPGIVPAPAERHPSLTDLGLGSARRTAF